MKGRNRDATKLGRVLDAAEHTATADRPESGWCGLCDRSLATAEGVVEVTLGSGETGDPDALLCPSCYGYVVAEMGIAPTRVFKAGRHRTVVLPIDPQEGYRPSSQWD